MSVIWVSQEEDPVDQGPPILAEYLIHQALSDSDRQAEFEECYQRFHSDCGPTLRDFLTRADAGRTVPDDSCLVEQMQDILKPWCEAWGGVSDHVFGQAVTVAVLRFYGVPRQKATRRDRELILAPFGLEVDEDYETLPNPLQPQSQKTARLRKEADLCGKRESPDTWLMIKNNAL